MTTATERTVAPFGIEADPPRNGDILLQAIKGCRLRGALDASKPTVMNKQDPDNMPVIPIDQAMGMASLPKVPGMQIHVNPAKLTYKIIDPLHDDEELCERILRKLRASESGYRPEKIRGVPPQSGTLDKHLMKTLVRELVNLVGANEAKVAQGTVPAMEDVDALPGRYRMNGGSEMWNQPRFEDQFEEWNERLTRSGG